MAHWRRVALAVGGAVLLIASPIPWLCPIRLALGVPCPTCGITRAARLVLAGDLAAAWAMHPGVFVLVPLFVAWAVALATGRDLLRVQSARIALALLAGAFFVFWLARFAGFWGGPVPT